MDYLSFIREMRCGVCFDSMVGTDAHHLKSVGMGNNRKKMTDQDHINHGVVALCRPHHQEYHTIGIKAFEKMYHVNLWKDAYMNLLEWKKQSLL